MLRKLLKYEIQATARIMLPLYLAVLGLGLGTRLLALWRENLSYTFQHWDPVNLFLGLFTGGFVLALFAVFVVATVLMILRFRNNLLTDEGYVMFTLPVNSHQLVWAKLLTSTLWVLGAFLVDALALLVLSAGSGFIGELLNGFRAILSNITAYYLGHGVLAIAELILLILLGSFLTCLQFYAPLSIGHSFARHKMLLSVAFYFVIMVASQVAVTVLITLGAPFLPSLEALTESIRPEAVVHLGLWVAILFTLLYGAVLYCLTNRMLHRHLNLE